jgi:hypothetical protein
MFQGDRGVVQEFAPSEMLYLRYTANQMATGQLTPDAIRSTEQSVNRALFSEPEDLLFSEDGRYNKFGVLEFAVFIIPTRIDTESGKPFFFSPRHVPHPENYAHSEVWASHEPGGESRKPRHSIGLRFRALLVQRISQSNIKIAAVD